MAKEPKRAAKDPKRAKLPIDSISHGNLGFSQEEKNILGLWEKLAMDHNEKIFTYYERLAKWFDKGEVNEKEFEEARKIVDGAWDEAIDIVHFFRTLPKYPSLVEFHKQYGMPPSYPLPTLVRNLTEPIDADGIETEEDEKDEEYDADGDTPAPLSKKSKQIKKRRTANKDI